MNEIEQNKVLVAQPFLHDPYFRRSVILLVSHEDENTTGFVINKPLKTKLGELVSHLKGADYPVYHGGPVAQDQLFFLHRLGGLIKNSHFIGDNYYWNGDYADLITLILNKQLKPEDIKFFIGYSGWGKGQLQDELAANSWYLKPADYEILIRNGSHDLWGAELKKMGNQHAVLSNFPDDPWMN